MPPAGLLPLTGRHSALLVMLGLLLACAAHTAFAQGAADARSRSYDIPPGPLALVLNRFAEQSGLALVYPAEITDGRHSDGLRGNHPAMVALRILLTGTGIEASEGNAGTVTLRMAAIPAQLAAVEIEPVEPRPLRIADVTVLSPLLVQSERPEDEVYRQPLSISRIGREDIERTGARHASEILQATPGVFTVTNEQNPSVSVDIRGLKDFGRVNMNIDGMRQNYQRSGHQQRNGEMFFDPEFLSSVEVLKGPNTGIGGAGVTGGVASFRTLQVEDILKPDADLGMRLRASTGIGKWANGSDPSGSIALARRGETLDLLLAYSQKNSGAYEPGSKGKAFNIPFATLPLNVVSLTDQDQESLMLKGRWKITPRQNLQLTAIGTRADYAESSMQDLDGAFRQFAMCTPLPPPDDPLYEDCVEFGSNAYDPDQVYPFSSQSRTTSASYGLDYDWAPLDHSWVDLSAKLYYVVTDSETLSAGDTTSLFITQTDTVGAWASNSAHFTFTDTLRLDWHFGIEAFLDRNQPDARSTALSQAQLEDANATTPQGKRLLAGAYTRFTLAYRSWLEIRPGLRYDTYRLWGNTGFAAFDSSAGRPLPQYADIDVDRREGKFLPTLGITLTPLPSLQFFANAGLGWRPPAITETLIAGNTPGHLLPLDYYPNWRLESEETLSLEAGINIRLDDLLAKQDNLRIKAAWFENETDNYIFFANTVALPGSSGPGLFNNMFANSVDPVTFRGVELDVRYDAGIYFLDINATRIERDATFRRLIFPAGGASGPLAAILNAAVMESASLYTPAPPEYNGQFTLGLRLLQRKLTLSGTLRCASASSGPMEHEAEDYQNDFCAIDAYGNYQATRWLSMGFNLRNITDRRYAQIMSDAYVRTYAPGRTLTAFMELRF